MNFNVGAGVASRYDSSTINMMRHRLLNTDDKIQLYWYRLVSDFTLLENDTNLLFS
jgi:hypothetical protein